ncbi:hypothetical protein [Actinokineospora sp.]|uniref:hypothetical protein n=1 Tax=Actinokineospora sp. TaxID=1872133 RepID=UPI003D6C10D2
MGEVTLRVDGGDDAAGLDRLTTLLFSDLRALGVAKVTRADGVEAHGGKSGTTQSIAELILTGALPAAAITGVYKTVTAFLDRAKARSVTWRQGDQEIVLTALSSDEQRKFIEKLGETPPRDPADG